jgi:hypothetical protein
MLSESKELASMQSTSCGEVLRLVSSQLGALNSVSV